MILAILAAWTILPGLIWIGFCTLRRFFADLPRTLDAAEAEEFGEMWGRRVEEKRHVAEVTNSLPRRNMS
jgi:hypothetical protein